MLSSATLATTQFLSAAGGERQAGKRAGGQAGRRASGQAGTRASGQEGKLAGKQAAPPARLWFEPRGILGGVPVEVCNLGGVPAVDEEQFRRAVLRLVAKGAECRVEGGAAAELWGAPKLWGARQGCAGKPRASK